jgi:hypothetical protein
MSAGSDSGGERAAAMNSLIGSCKLNGINPRFYLEYVLTHIADHQANRIDELLPWNIPKHLLQSTLPRFSPFWQRHHAPAGFFDACPENSQWPPSDAYGLLSLSVISIPRARCLNCFISR